MIRRTVEVWFSAKPRHYARVHAPNRCSFVESVAVKVVGRDDTAVKQSEAPSKSPNKFACDKDCLNEAAWWISRTAEEDREVWMVGFDSEDMSGAAVAEARDACSTEDFDAEACVLRRALVKASSSGRAVILGIEKGTVVDIEEEVRSSIWLRACQDDVRTADVERS